MHTAVTSHDQTERLLTEEPGLVLGVEEETAEVVEVTRAVGAARAELLVAEQLLGMQQLDVAVMT